MTLSQARRRRRLIALVLSLAALTIVVNRFMEVYVHNQF